MEKNDKFPTRKDMTYWIIILILFMVGSFTVYYGSNKDMVSHIGFGGTIVSILLAVIAIIYSFYQSSTYESTTYKLDTSAQKIEEATKQLSDVSEIKTVLESFKGEVKEINESIIDLKGISNNIGNGVNSMKESFENTKTTFFESFNPISPKHVEVDEIDFSTNYFIKMLDNGGNFPLFTLALANQAHINKISKVNLRQYNKIYMKFLMGGKQADLGKDIHEAFRNIQFGMLSAYKSSRFVDIDFVEDDFIQINDINENLSQAIVHKVESLNDEQDGDKPLYDFLLTMKNKLSWDEE
ncbi:hypothetical protein KM918_27020 [Priestia megaterium]|uniref:hypothetical protein n=1 Tax=Priestia megaterium TaxID=1404 RepID=UPI001C23252C|nr:hypothetical protein [Priestia megaterium]MBU8690940.1 hypothetical protein [Priestia megaterium]